MIKQMFAMIMLVLMVVPVYAVEGRELLREEVRCINAVQEDSEQLVRCMPNPRLDVVFLVDSTGSMSDEIRSVKTHIIKIVGDVQQGNPRPDLRVGVVTYRDHGDVYVHKEFDLTYDVEEALEFIESIDANGGGDYPEAVEIGLYEAVHKMNWDRHAKKVMFLIGDAKPYGYSDSRYPEQESYKDIAGYARGEGIKIYTISGSGMDPVGVDIWREIARITNAQYEQLKYERRDVDQYYRDEGVDERWAVEAKADTDYDRKSNSILTNTFGSFAKSAMVAEAQEMGVEYDEPVEDPRDGIDYNDITGSAVEPVVEVKETKLATFFKKVFDKLIFWD